jgi:hypothetical protein
MPRESNGPHNDGREARQIADAVETARGNVERLGDWHFRIIGPLGSAVVSSAPSYGRPGNSALASTLEAIQRETGLPVAPHGDPLPCHPDKYRNGEITQWKPGENYGLITSDDGQSWIVARDNLPGRWTRLPERTRIVFFGSPEPEPGKSCPEATYVRVIRIPV